MTFDPFIYIFAGFVAGWGTCIVVLLLIILYNVWKGEDRVSGFLYNHGFERNR